MKGPDEGTTLLDKVEAAIRRFRMFSQGDTVGIAVSGGRDSICLFDLFQKQAQSWGIKLIVLHVNHRLRPESEAEEEFVRALAAQDGIECLVDRPELDPGNLEEAARKARLRFFEAAPCDRVATAHTRSDQAETVLFRLLRGSGTTGLAGIRPVRGRFIRPMIDVTREEVNDWVTSHALQYWEDRSNTEMRFARNRIRHQLLPQLEQEWNPRLSEVLANAASVAALEEDFFNQLLPRPELEPDGSVVLNIRDVLEVHPALARRTIRRAISLVKGDLGRIDFSHIERILAMSPGHDRVIVPGVDVIRSFEWLRFAVARFGSPEPRNWSMEAALPLETAIPGNQHISIGFHPDGSRYNEIVHQLSVKVVEKSLLLRNWRPGDKIFRERDNGAVRLKQLFQENRIPLWERRNWPVLESAGEIVWAGEFGAAAGVEGDGPYVKLTRLGRSYRPI